MHRVRTSFLTMDYQPNMSSTNKKPVTILNLPRELRQNILAIAFEHAASKDIKLNQSLRKLNWEMKKEAHELVEMVNHPRYVDTEPPFYQSYVPTIQDLAYALGLAFPALEEDSKVILSRCLEKFEEENNEVYKKEELKNKLNEAPIPVFLPFPRPAQRGWFTIAEQMRRVRLG